MCKLSLNQLNQYFRQPVLNSHVLTAQRLADGISDKTLREAVYQSIIKKVIELISDRDAAEVPSLQKEPVVSRGARRKKLDTDDGSSAIRKS
jgi:hypothetical protein